MRGVSARGAAVPSGRERRRSVGNSTENGVISAAALVTALEAMSALPDTGRAGAARDVAQQLIAGYGVEAVNVALKCQNAFMERGEDAAAAGMLSVLTAIWEIEDSPRV